MDKENLDIIKANLKFFQAKAGDYNKEEPSYRPENIKRVNNILLNIMKRKQKVRLLDVGCGTGFVIDLAYKFTKDIVGVDISNEMLKKVETKNGKIMLVKSDTSHLPLESNSFDVCTSYGFLHHLYNIRPTIKEAYRCLKKGGIFYADQDPNYYFWQHAKQFDYRKIINEIPRTEIINVNDPTDGYKKRKMKSLDAVGKKTIVTAEYQKTSRGGFREEEIIKILKNIGFRQIEFTYEWYIGEAYAKHSLEKNSDEIIERHMRRCLPLTRNLFKYVRFIAVK